MDPLAVVVIALVLLGGLGWFSRNVLSVSQLLDRLRRAPRPEFSLTVKPLRGLETPFEATITLASGGPAPAPHLFATVDGSEVSQSLGSGMWSDSDSETVTSIVQRRVLSEIHWVLFWRDVGGALQGMSESGHRRTWGPKLRLGPRPRSKAAQVEDQLRDAFGVERIHPKRRLERVWRWFERDPITGHWPVLYHREKVEMEPAEVFRAFYKTVAITGTAPASLKRDRRATGPRA